MKVVLDCQTKFLKMSQITVRTMVKSPGQLDKQFISQSQNTDFSEAFFKMAPKRQIFGHHVLTKSQNHHVLKRLYSSKNKGNAIKSHIVSSVDGKGVFMLFMSVATSYSCTDKRVMKYLTYLEANHNLFGGPNNVFAVILLDLGYIKGWFVHGNNATFSNTLDQLNNQTGGRVNYQFPPGSHDQCTTL